MTEDRNDAAETAGGPEKRTGKQTIVHIYAATLGVVGRFFRDAIFVPDFWTGVVVGIGVGFWAYYKHSVQLDEGGVLNTDIGASVGLLAVTLATMALIIGFLQGFYADLIRSVPDGEREFFYPFKVIAVVSGGAAISGLVSSLDADSSPLRLSSILFGLSVGLLTWAIVGAVQLVFIFVGHGTTWLELDDALDGPPPTEDTPKTARNAEPSGETAGPDKGQAEV